MVWKDFSVGIAGQQRDIYAGLDAQRPILNVC